MAVNEKQTPVAEVIRLPSPSETYLTEWCSDRELNSGWGALEPLAGFLPQIQFITHDPDGNPRPELSATRTKGGTYRSARGSGACIYAPKPASHRLFREATVKDIAEGQGKVLSLLGGGYAPLGIGGCFSFRGPDKKLHPWLAAGINPGDTVRLWLDADWHTNKDVHVAAHMLMAAVRALGAKPLLMDISQLQEGNPKLGIDDLRARWKRAGLDVELLTKTIPGRETIENPFTVDVNDPRHTARNFLAAYYSTEQGPNLKYWQGDFYTWGGSGWECEQGEDVIRANIHTFMEQHGAKGKTAQVNNVLDSLRGLVQLAIKEAPTWLVPPPAAAPEKPGDLLAVSNGLLNLATGELLPATPNYFNINWTDIAYDPTAKCSRWRQFLGEVYPGNEATQECLQEFMGYCLTTDTTLQKALMLIGPLRSGKGTIGRVLQQLVGPSAYCATTLATLGERFGKQHMIGKKVAVVAEARMGKHVLGQGTTESLLTISGEDVQIVDRKNRDPWQGQLQCRFVVMSNMLPAMQDTGMALAERFIYLEHTVSFINREETGLESALAAERPGILTWAIEGLRRLRARGRFVQTAAGRDMAREMARLGSPVSAFVEEECVVRVGAKVAKKDLMNRHVLWCSENGQAPVPESHLTQALKCVNGLIKPGQQADKKRVYWNIELRRREI